MDVAEKAAPLLERGTHHAGPWTIRGEPKPWTVAAAMPECSEGTNAAMLPYSATGLEPLIDLDPGMTKNLLENA